MLKKTFSMATAVIFAGFSGLAVAKDTMKDSKNKKSHDITGFWAESRPLDIASERLAKEGWYPIAGGRSGKDIETIFMRRQGTGDVRVVSINLAKDVNPRKQVQVNAEGTLIFADKPKTVDQKEREDEARAIKFQIPPNGEEHKKETAPDPYGIMKDSHFICFDYEEAEDKMGEFHQVPVMQILVKKGETAEHVLTVYAGLIDKEEKAGRPGSAAGGLEWTILMRGVASDDCVAARGLGFSISPGYPDFFLPEAKNNDGAVRKPGGALPAPTPDR